MVASDDQHDRREKQAESREVQAEEREAKVDAKEGRLQAAMRLVLWATVLLIVVSSISVIRSFFITDAVNQLENTTRDLTTATEESKEASIEARNALQEALDQAAENSEASGGSEAVKAALESIARIEAYLCGGPCEAKDSTPNG